MFPIQAKSRDTEADLRRRRWTAPLLVGLQEEEVPEAVVEAPEAVVEAPLPRRGDRP